MTEPVSASSALITVTAGGVTLLGLATGLDPLLLLAGAWGGWWAQSYQPPAGAMARLNRVLIAAVAAAWGSPPLVGWLASRTLLTDEVPGVAWEAVAALGIGLLAVDVLGRGLLKLAAAKFRRHEQ